MRPDLRVIVTSAYGKETADASFAGLRVDHFIRKTLSTARHRALAWGRFVYLSDCLAAVAWPSMRLCGAASRCVIRPVEKRCDDSQTCWTRASARWRGTKIARRGRR